MKTILLVDDDKTMQAALSRRLQEQGFKVLSALSAVEALDKFQESSPDVVVSDVMMPKMDGFEFCRQLRSSPSGQLVPFIFLSCMGEVESRILGHTIGGDDYLVKPFHPQELIAKIEHLLQRASLIHQEVERLVEKRQVVEGDSVAPPPLPFTPAEEKVFSEVIQGYTNKQIGDRLFISPRTVQTHLSNILSKLALDNRAQLIRFAYENGYGFVGESQTTESRASR